MNSFSTKTIENNKFDSWNHSRVVSKSWFEMLIIIEPYDKEIKDSMALLNIILF